MLKVKAASNLAKFAENARAKLGPTLGLAFILAAQTVQSEIERQILSSFSGGRGRLAKSFKPKTIKRSSSSLEGGVYSTKRYAGIQNRGGTVTAKNGQYLTIPITPQARRTKAIRFPGLVFIHHPPQLPVLAKEAGLKGAHGPARLVPQYILVRKISIRGTHYLDRAQEASLPRAQAIVAGGMRELIKRSSPPPIAVR